MPGRGSREYRPFGFARFLSWSSFVVIVALSLTLSIFIANSAKETLLKKQQEFALLLAQNLNHQIYRRFTLPTIIGFGRVELQQRAQYDRLDQVVSANVHGLSVQDLYIFSNEGKVSYAMDDVNVGREDLAGEAVDLAAKEGRHTFEIRTRHSLLWAMFQWELEADSVTLKTTFPLRAERGLNPRSALSGPIMGVLQFSQDITEDYKSVIHFQWVIISTSLVSSLVLFFILMTIIKRAERTVAERMVEKERLERELHQSERLASMGRVVATIAHEVRNPLGIIRSSAELLLKRLDEHDPQAKIIRAVFDESLRLSKTVNDFLDYARPKQPRQDQVDLSKVLDQALGFLDPECAKREVAVERRYLGGLVVLGDKDQLYRAFYNILSNGLQAMERGGTIRIESETPGDEVVVAVRDTGPGFDEKVMDKLMDPFFTTKDTGTGLGLAIVNNIVSGHGGTLELSNHPQGGAVVRARFPKPGKGSPGPSTV